jgi:putative DNA primase/helicase
VEGTARELLAEAEDMGDDGEGGSLGNAKRFLAGLLADGPMSRKAIQADADGAGYAWATIRRAKDLLGVEAVKEGFGKSGGWVWRFPAKALNDEHLSDELLRCSKPSKGAQEKKVSILGEFEHLKEEDAKVLKVLNNEHLSGDDYVVEEL